MVAIFYKSFLGIPFGISKKRYMTFMKRKTEGCERDDKFATILILSKGHIKVLGFHGQPETEFGETLLMERPGERQKRHWSCRWS